MIPPDHTLPSPAEVAEALETWAAATHDANARAAYQRAARAIAQSPPGRPRIDDHRLLADARHLISSGRAKSAWQAFEAVARRGPVRESAIDRRAASPEARQRK